MILPMSVTAIALFVSGGVFELVGIVLVGSPDFFPEAERASRWLRDRWTRFVDRLLVMLGRPRDRVVVVGVADAFDMSDHASVMKSADPNASLEEKVAFLLQRDQEAQRAANALSARLASTERESPKRLEELQGEMEQHVTDTLAAAHGLYLPLRLVGAGLLVVGLGCATAGNFA